MTREEHIEAAERLLAGPQPPFIVLPPSAEEVARAQVHATLALAMTPSSEATPTRVSWWPRKVAR